MFGAPIISLEWVKVDILNLVYRLIAVSTIIIMHECLDPNGVCSGSRDPFDLTDLLRL